MQLKHTRRPAARGVKEKDKYLVGDLLAHTKRLSTVKRGVAAIEVVKKRMRLRDALPSQGPWSARLFRSRLRPGYLEPLPRPSRPWAFEAGEAQRKRRWSGAGTAAADVE